MAWRRGERAATIAAVALTAAAAFSARLGLANPLLGIALLLAIPALRAGALAGRPWARAVTWPIVVFAGLTVVSALFSQDPLVSIANLPRLAVLAAVPLAAALVDLAWWRRMVMMLAAMTAYVATSGILEYVRGPRDLDNRISGPLSHYMTFSGWLMLAVLVLVVSILLDRRRAVWLLVPPTVLGIVAILLSYTRNAWVGLAAGVLVLAAVWRRRILLLYPLLAILVWLVFPRAVLDRALSIVDLRQPANYDRLCMVVSGAQMVRDHPWTGVGPDMVRRIYPLYRRDDAPRWRVPHLHNNPLQIAAERGLPALGAYVWLIAAFATVTWRRLKTLAGPPRSVVAAALVGITGITVAGLFEYNFWDAEIQLLTLVVLGAGVGQAEREAP